MTPCSPIHAAGGELRRCPSHTRIHRVLPRAALLAQASDAMLATSTWPRTLPLVRPFACGTALQPSHRLLRPLLTSRSGSTPSPFRAQGEISPGKNALLHCTTAGFTPLPLDHESLAVSCPLALVGNAFYPVLVHRPAASLHASSPHSVTLMQLRFASLVVINSRWDFHPQECAHAGRTGKKGVGNRQPLEKICMFDFLPLRELEGAAGFCAAVLLALDHAAVAGEEAFLLQSRAEFRLEIG
jgi:hypothetical protein